MAGYKHTQLKNKSFEEIQMLFDNNMKWIDSFVPIDSKVVEGSKKAKADKAQESSSKRAADEELEQERAKKQKIDNAKEEAEMGKLINIVPDEEEVAIDAIPLATKPPSIGRSSKKEKEDLETLWKLVKAKHGDTRPEEEYERVLWGDLKAMFEPDIRSEVWRNLQGYKVTVWKMFHSCKVHFVRFQNLHIFMLVEKRYPLSPITITNMRDKKLQTDHWNEMCYQLLNLMVKQQKKE
ncbi:hypothetical protein Tco_1031228 [Tanacetum coccineum]|uniref:Uncharacterized protein n=1 Tax=Tanacetum coccineum TaxID=301880 RepID=A0ABQ5G8E6_9ASTR